MDYKQIVWLASYPKSGNTWLRCFLDAYHSGSVDINEILTSVADDNAARCLPGDGSDPSKYAVDIQALTRPMGLLRLVRQYSLNNVTIPLYVKTHAAHMVVNGVELLPAPLTKAVICIVRDPRDVIISFSKHMGLDMDKAIDVFFDKYRVLQDERKPKMADFICSWPASVMPYANADTHNVRVWRYEDMKADPDKVFSEMLKHADVTPDAARVREAVAAVTLANLQKQETDKGFRESSPHAENKFFGDGKTGKWHGNLTPGQIHRLEKQCRPLLKRFGYLDKAQAA